MVLIHRVRTLWTGVAGSPAYSNLYFLNTGISAAAAVTAVTSLMTGLQAVQASGVRYDVEGDVALVDTATDSVVGVTTTGPTTGTVSGSFVMLPSATQMLIRTLTGAYAGGRQIRGRLFVPYIRTGSANGPVPAGAAITSVNSAVNALVAASSSSWVVYSPTNSNAYPVSAYSVWTQFAVMRSRRD